MVISENVAALMQSPLVVEMNDAEVSALARIVQIRDCKDGEVLVEEGESNSHLYVPVSGKIAITKRDEHNEWNVLHTLRAGDLAGELSFMDGEPRFASLVANGATRVLVLERSDFEAILTQTHASLVRQYQALLATEGVTLEFTPEGIRRLAEIAWEVNERTENIGARRLHTVLERLLEEASFDAADLAARAEHIVIDAAYVDARLQDLHNNDDLSRFIL